MATQWERVEKNIYRDKANKKKFRVDLYYGRDENGKPKKRVKHVIVLLEKHNRY